MTDTRHLRPDTRQLSGQRVGHVGQFVLELGVCCVLSERVFRARSQLVAGMLVARWSRRAHSIRGDNWRANCPLRLALRCGIRGRRAQHGGQNARENCPIMSARRSPPDLGRVVAGGAGPAMFNDPVVMAWDPSVWRPAFRINTCGSREKPAPHGLGAKPPGKCPFVQYRSTESRCGFQRRFLAT